MLEQHGCAARFAGFSMRYGLGHMQQLRTSKRPITSCDELQAMNNSVNISMCCADLQQVGSIIWFLAHGSDLCSKRGQQQLLTVRERREVGGCDFQGHQECTPCDVESIAGWDHFNGWQTGVSHCAYHRGVQHIHIHAEACKSSQSMMIRCTVYSVYGRLQGIYKG